MFDSGPLDRGAGRFDGFIEFDRSMDTSVPADIVVFDQPNGTGNPTDLDVLMNCVSSNWSNDGTFYSIDCSSNARVVEEDFLIQSFSVSGARSDDGFEMEAYTENAQPVIRRGAAPAPSVTISSKKTFDTTPEIQGTVVRGRTDDGNFTIVSVRVSIGDQGPFDATLNNDGTWVLADNTLAPLSLGTYDVQATARDSGVRFGTDTTTDELTIEAKVEILDVQIANQSPGGSPTDPIVAGDNFSIRTVFDRDVRAIDLGFSYFSQADAEGDSYGNSLGGLPDFTLSQGRFTNTNVTGDTVEQFYRIDGSLAETLQVRSVSATPTTPGFAVSDPFNFDLTITENIRPNVTIDDLSPVTDQSPELTGTVDDSTATVEVTIDGSTYTAEIDGTNWSIAQGTIGPLADGSYNLEVTATDPAGNVGTANDPDFTVQLPKLAVFSGLDVEVGFAIENGDMINLGNFPIGNAPIELALVLENLGIGKLTISDLIVQNAMNATSSPVGGNKSLGPGAQGTQTVLIGYNELGAFSFDVVLPTNDPTHPNFTVSFFGTWVESAPRSQLKVVGAGSGRVANGGQTDIAPLFTSDIVAGVQITDFTVQVSNIGDADHPPISATIISENNVSAVVASVETGTIAPGGTDSKDVAFNFTPTGPGAFSFQVEITSSETLPFRHTFTGTALDLPEIAVASSNSGALTDGATDDLGATLPQAGRTLTYTIENKGSADLVVSDITESAPVNATVSVLPTTFTVLPMATQDVSVTITPDAEGPVSFELDIVSNDTDEGTFDIAVTGTADFVAPVVTVTANTTGNPTPTLTGTVNDSTATVAVTVDSQGPFAAVIEGSTWRVDGSQLTDLAVDTYDIIATATDPAGNQASDSTTDELIIETFNPNIEVRREDVGGPPLNDGTFDYGVVRERNDDVSFAFDVSNTGNADLTLGALKLDDLAASGITLVFAGQSHTIVPPGETRSNALGFGFLPDAFGAFSFDVVIPSNDPDEPETTVTFTGNYAEAERYTLTSPTGNIISTSGTEESVTETIGTAGKTLTFTVTNTGNLDVTLPAFGISILSNITGQNVIIPAESLTIPVGQNAMFDVVITPTTSGAFSFRLSFDSGRSIDSPISLFISGVADVDAPIVAVDNLPPTTDTSPALSGTVDDDTAEIDVTVNGETLRADNNGSTWSIDRGRFDPLGDDTYDVTVRAKDTAGNVTEETFDDALTVQAPKLVLVREIDNASEETISNDGEIDIGTQTATLPAPDDLSFRIENAGSLALTYGDIFVENLANVSVPTVGTKSGTVQPGAEKSSGFSYTPTNAGAFSFDYVIPSNDPTTPSFRVTIKGTAEDPAPEMEVRRVANGTQGDVIGDTETWLLGELPKGQNNALFDLHVFNIGTADLPEISASIKNPLNVAANIVFVQDGETSPGPFYRGINFSFTPLDEGAFSFDIEISNSATPTYTVTLSGTAVSVPDIALSREAPPSISLSNGDTDTLTDPVGLSGTTLVFSLENDGSADLDVSSIALSPAGATNISGDVEISPTSAILMEGGAVEVLVTFTPAATGAFGFDLVIVSDDPDEDPFELTVSGQADLDAPVIALNALSATTDSSPALSGTVDDQNATVTVTIDGTDYDATVNGMAWSIAQDVIGPLADDTYDVTVRAEDTAGNVTEETFDDVLTIQAPKIQVQDPDSSVLDSGGSYDAGVVLTGVETTLTFPVENLGTTLLTLDFPTVSAGVNVEKISTARSETVAAGASGGFASVTFTPIAASGIAFDLTIPSDDPTVPSFTVAISGTAEDPAPVVEVKSVIDGTAGAVVVSGDKFNVGNLIAGVETTSFGLQVGNTGTADLPAISVSTKDADNVSVETPIVAAGDISPNDTPKDIQLTFTPNDPGDFSFEVVISSTATPAYSVIVNGTAGTAPDIAVSSSNAGVLSDGGTDAISDPVGPSGTTLTYTISNEGAVDLIISDIALASAGATNISGAVQISSTSTTIAANGSVDVTVTFAPAAEGAFGFDLEIDSNDPDEDPFDITVSGTGDFTPPADFSVEFDQDPINKAAVDAGDPSFTITGGEVDATYTYEVTTAGSTEKATGTGTMSTVNQSVSIPKADLSVFEDGSLLTLSVTLTDAVGQQ
ncbi:MAG: choice-of-anchor D domain-containing protein, partial [Pseudomonadota bacterium]